MISRSKLDFQIQRGLVGVLFCLVSLLFASFFACFLAHLLPPLLYGVIWRTTTSGQSEIAKNTDYGIMKTKNCNFGMIPSARNRILVLSLK